MVLRLLPLRTGIICIFGGNERRGNQIRALLVVRLLSMLLDGNVRRGKQILAPLVVLRRLLLRIGIICIVGGNER